MSYVPDETTLAGVIGGDASTAAMAESAARGRATPNSPQWASVEADNPIKPYMTAVLEGKDPKESAKAASERITAELLSAEVSGRDFRSGRPDRRFAPVRLQ